MGDGGGRGNGSVRVLVGLEVGDEGLSDPGHWPGLLYSLYSWDYYKWLSHDKRGDVGSAVQEVSQRKASSHSLLLCWKRKYLMTIVLFTPINTQSLFLYLSTPLSLPFHQSFSVYSFFLSLSCLFIH